MPCRHISCRETARCYMLPRDHDATLSRGTVRHYMVQCYCTTSRHPADRPHDTTSWRWTKRRHVLVIDQQRCVVQRHHAISRCAGRRPRDATSSCIVKRKRAMLHHCAGRLRNATPAERPREHDATSCRAMPRRPASCSETA